MKFGLKNELKSVFMIVALAGIGVAAALSYCYWQATKELALDNLEMSISAGVVPHHLLASEMIEDFFSYVASCSKPKTIVLLAPDHFNSAATLGNSFITLAPEIKEFKGIEIDDFLIKKLLEEKDFIFSNSSIQLDHGITNLIPFIKEYLPDTKILPFIVPQNLLLEETRDFAVLLDSLASSDTFVVASVDFSHYLPFLAAGFHDVKSIRGLIDFEKDDFSKMEVDSWQALYVVRDFAFLRGKESVKLIGRHNAVDFTGNKEAEETTSYFSLVFEQISSNTDQSEISKGKTVLMVGDIMLDRGTEYFIEKNSPFYPFEKTRQFLRGVDIIFGNLEGPIVKQPIHFSNESLKFAFSSELTSQILSLTGFNLFSLANNHTLDMARTGLSETKSFLTGKGIGFVGDPLSCGEEFLFREKGITFFSFNRTFPFNCEDQEIINTLKSVRMSYPDDFLIISPHWGEEYKLSHSLWQEEMAHRMIDAGADLIVGHHPHVVQPIEEYKNKLIFYSLGNFIFDQGFSEETQQGLAIGIEIYPEKTVYKLFPIGINKTQAFLMAKTSAMDFLNALALRSNPELSSSIKNSIIEIQD